MIHHLYKFINEKKIFCFNVETIRQPTETELTIILDLIDTNLDIKFDHNDYIEYGPYPNLISPWCTNALTILKKCGIKIIKRIEQSILIKKEFFKDRMVDKMTQMIYKNKITSFDTQPNMDNIYFVTDIEEENKKEKLGFDDQDIDYYKELFKNRNPTNLELLDLSQSNSEHSRHWFFNGNLIKNDKKLPSLFQMIKGTQKNNNNSIIAFSDNASAIRGSIINYFHVDLNNKFTCINQLFHPTFTAETHNFPTSVAPFPGAATGTGGRIRDNQCIGRGGLCIAGLTGYSVGDIKLERNVKILIEASNGASDYGNKFGEPVIGGFCRSYGKTMDRNERIEYMKPIMFSAGIGQLNDMHKNKIIKNEKILVIRLGGPAYRIGMCGGSASSRDQKTKNECADYDAVQRGDPEMENKLNRVIRKCIDMGDNNPILSIHDQGAGGMANVTKEIIYPWGANINLDKVILGDQNMTAMEIWISEHQEQNTVLISEKDKEFMKKLCKKENLPIANIGELNNTGFIEVKKNGKIVEELELEKIMGKNVKTYYLDERLPYFCSNKFNSHNIVQLLINVLKSPSVCSKRFLVNKVDRSVGGLIAQQQCVGPLHTPLSDYNIVAQSFFNKSGIISAIGEKPIIGLIDPAAMARMSIGEMLTNIIFAGVSKLENIKCSGNWMWPAKFSGEKYRIYCAVKAMCDAMEKLGIALDGGKDSLSMSYQNSKTKEIIKAPGTLVISGYVDTPNITNGITPDFKINNNRVYYINLSNGKYRLGGSILMETQNCLGNECPDADINLLKYVFNKMQELDIISGHDVSDGGFITTLLEMCFAGNKGFRGNINGGIEMLFAEELGLIVEVENDKKLYESFDKSYCIYIGQIINEDMFELDTRDGNIKMKMTELRDIWESTSFELDKLQTNEKCVESEYFEYKNMFGYQLDDIITNHIESIKIKSIKPKVAVIREEGSNGDREMAAILYDVGFDVYDIIIDDQINLEMFRGIIFVGGFSYSDVFGAAKGWYQTIISNKKIKDQFDIFYNRDDTFSLGICNGCQLMAHLGWIPATKLVKNDSGRFESRFSRVRINKSNSIMLKNMENNILGIWVAHQEGKFILKEKIENIPIQYVDYKNNVAEKYPFNPNGSENAIAGLCSNNGRHLAMMPHPERTVFGWQIPYGFQKKQEYTTWYLMFKNAYKWC